MESRSHTSSAVQSGELQDIGGAAHGAAVGEATAALEGARGHGQAGSGEKSSSEEHLHDGGFDQM